MLMNIASLILRVVQLVRHYLTAVFMANCAQIYKLSVVGEKFLPDIVGCMVKFLLTVLMQ